MAAHSTPYHLLRITRGLKKLIELRGWTKRKFAEVTKIFPQDVNKYLAAELNPENLLLALYEAGEDIEWIKSGGETSRSVVRDATESTGHLAPLLGRIVVAHDGKEICETKQIPAGAGIPFFAGNFFCLEIANDSLINAKPPIFPGEICVFEAKRQPKKGEIAAVHLTGDRRMVKVLTHASRIELRMNAANNFRSFPELKVKKSALLGIGTFVMKLQLTDDVKRRFGLKE
jgi:SOS-response transcriptional repressor LexA